MKTEQEGQQTKETTEDSLSSMDRAKANLVVAKEIERKRLESGEWEWTRRDKDTMALVLLSKIKHTPN